MRKDCNFYHLCKILPFYEVLGGNNFAHGIELCFIDALLILFTYLLLVLLPSFLFGSVLGFIDALLIMFMYLFLVLLPSFYFGSVLGFIDALLILFMYLFLVLLPSFLFGSVLILRMGEFQKNYHHHFLG